MDLNESETCDPIQSCQFKTSALQMKLAFMWVAKHRAAMKYRCELQRSASLLMEYDILRDVVRKMKLHEVRLLRSLEISSSAMWKIFKSIEQIKENRKVGFAIRTAKFKAQIESYQQALIGFPLGHTWVLAFKKVQQLAKTISEEKQKLRSAQDELKKAKELHETNINEVKKNMQRIAGE